MSFNVFYVTSNIKKLFEQKFDIVNLLISPLRYGPRRVTFFTAPEGYFTISIKQKELSSLVIPALLFPQNQI